MRVHLLQTKCSHWAELSCHMFRRTWGGCSLKQRVIWQPKGSNPAPSQCLSMCPWARHFTHFAMLGAARRAILAVCPRAAVATHVAHPHQRAYGKNEKHFEGLEKTTTTYLRHTPISSCVVLIIFSVSQTGCITYLKIICEVKSAGHWKAMDDPCSSSTWIRGRGLHTPNCP